MPLHDKRECENCSEQYWPDRVTDRFCSKECKKEYKRLQNKNKAYNHLSTADIGEYTESLVALDLMDKGFNVFRSVNRSNPTDIVISKEGVGLLRVEVKAGRLYEPTGNIQTGTTANNIFDVLAIYELKNDNIIYEHDINNLEL